MNKALLTGRLTKDPNVRYSQGENQMCIARFTLAVDRRRSRNQDGNGQTADFISCVAFGKTGEFVEKYLRKGTKIVLDGEIQNDNYTNKEGKMVYGMRIIANNIEFAESKNAAGNGGFAPAEGPAPMPNTDIGDGFMDIDDGIEDDGIPFA